MPTKEISGQDKTDVLCYKTDDGECYHGNKNTNTRSTSQTTLNFNVV